MLKVHSLVPLLAALTSLALAILVGRSGPKSGLGRVFTALAVSLVFWNLNFFTLYAVQDYETAFALTRLFRTGAVFLLPLILHLSVALPEDKPSRRWSIILLLDYSLALILAILNWFNLLVLQLRKFQWGYYSVGSYIYNCFTIYVVVNFLLATALLIYYYRTTIHARTRLQLQFWLLGMAVALPLGLTNLMPTYGGSFYPLGNLGSAIWAAIVAYAIVRHRLLEIDIVVTKGIAYAGVIILLVGPVFFVTIAMQRWAFGEIHLEFSAALALMLTAVGVLFPYLRAKVESQLERSLFRQKYEGRAALTALAGEVVRILDRDKLINELCATLSKVFQLERVDFFLADKIHGKFQLRRALGPRPEIGEFGAHEVFIRWLAQAGEPVLCEEADGEDDGLKRGLIAAVFRANGWAVCVPFASDRQLVGFLGLGRKRNMEAFAVGDMKLLSSVAAETTVALQNARLYEELRHSQDIINRAGRLSALGTLAAGIAHEIRNPLVSIQTFFQLAPHRLHDDEFMTSFLRLAEGEVQRISRLISELLTFAKSPLPSVGQIDLGEVIDRALTLLLPQARAQNVELRHTPGGQLPSVVADPDQIMQVLINIVLNGLQASCRGGRVTVSTREVEDERGSFCQVEIHDTGPGIGGDIREAIFDPFFTTKDKGTGLGLAIAHRIIAESGGFIRVESVEGQGAHFYVHLPSAGRAGARGEVEDGILDSPTSGIVSGGDRDNEDGV